MRPSTAPSAPPDLYAPPLLPHLIARYLHLHGDAPCIHTGDGLLSYADVAARVSQFAQAQQALGITIGGRVAILSKNRPEVLINAMATAINGAALTPLHPLGSLSDHDYIIGDAAIHVLVFDVEHFGERAAEIRARHPDLILLGFGPNDVGHDLLALADDIAPRPLLAADVRPDHLCTISYTGGTTGRPKGTLLPHRVWQTMTWIQMAEWELPTPLRIALPTPLSHAALTVLAPVLVHGGCFYVMNGFAPDSFFDLVEQHRITCTMIVPVMLYALQDHPRYASADMSSMATILYGASPVSPGRLADAVEHWGPIFFQFFGQTEAPMAVTHLKRADHDLEQPERLASCGRPAPWLHVELLDNDNRPVAPGESGEICVRGPLVMDGYLGLPDGTAEALAGGWLHTGDVGRFDDDGYLYIVGRTKDMVISGGFNVFPREVEDVIATHPAVSMVMVIGVPDPKWGEAVKAIVVLKPGNQPSDGLTAELQQLVKDAKGSQQAPKSIDYVDSLPLTAVGKPDKKAVRARYWDSAEREIS